MLARGIGGVSEVHRRQSFERRIIVVQCLFGLICLVIIGRLIELQIAKGDTYRRIAEEQQRSDVPLFARRGEILSRNSKTGETSILATNTTLDLLYVDPLAIPKETTMAEQGQLADELVQILVTPEFDLQCRSGEPTCPPEFTGLYVAAFDPLSRVKVVTDQTGSGVVMRILTGALAGPGPVIPDITEIRRQFARSIENRIREHTVTFVPLLYGANKQQLAEVQKLGIAGISVNAEQKLVYADPDLVDQAETTAISRSLSQILKLDPSVLKARLLQRPLRYVLILTKLTPELSVAIRELKDRHAAEAKAKAAALNVILKKAKKELVPVIDPFRAVALVPQSWRYYPDTTIASHVVGFINTLQEPQYGIERAFHSVLRGEKGSIASVSDPFGGQIVSSNPTFKDAKDGSTIVLTIDRFIQSKVEELLAAMVKKVDAESGQVIILDPSTGRVLALANAPLFDNNTYAAVYEKEPIIIDPAHEDQLVVEVYNPETNVRVFSAFLPDILPEGRSRLPAEARKRLEDLEQLYDVQDITRTYLYLGINNRREIFPTAQHGVWLKYKNNIGIGSYVNRTIQELYEPGSVLKPITMSIAIDQGEVAPTDIYNDTGAIKVDKFIIKNALNKFYGKVSMVDCLDFSINTCMTSVSRKLGRKLFQSALDNLGFGRVTGIELDNELPGNLKPWRDWDPALLLTTAFGQGLSVTPIQMITAFAAIANGGKLVKPTIIDQIRHSDGTVDHKPTEVLAQVFKPETAATMTAILSHGAQVGFAKAGKVPGHRIAGKTGTSQIAGPGGKYETGTGSTIATYAGYAPLDHPQFVILVKLDRPKKDDFGSKSAAPLFKDIAAFLFEYYGIPPDEK